MHLKCSGLEVQDVKELAARKIRGFRGTIDERGNILTRFTKATRGSAEWLTSKERPPAVVDLLCWAKAGSLETDEELPAQVADHLTQLFGVDDFEDAALVPSQAGEMEESLQTWQPIFQFQDSQHG